MKIVGNNHLSLSYEVFGNLTSNKHIICFHGHGRSSKDFSFLDKTNCKAIAINLFFHEESFFDENRVPKNPLEWKEFEQLFEEVLVKEQISTYHLFAFSQGGRFCLKILEKRSHEILSCTVMAPDGLNMKTIYNKSSHNIFATKLFSYVAKKPNLLNPITKSLHSLKLIRPKVSIFLAHYSEDKNELRKAYYSWSSFRNINPDPVIIGDNIRDKNIPFRIIMGKYDQIIRTKQAEIFCRNASLSLDKIVEIDSGHNFFKESTIKKFYKHLLFINDL